MSGKSGLFRRRGPLFTAIATRRALVDYLLGVAAILFILMSVAYTIDLAGQFGGLRDAAEERQVPLSALLPPYLGQRGVDIVTRMLPVAIFFGVFLAEILRRMRLESVILATAGASPLRSFAAILWLSLLLGVVNWGLESRWRPAAVLAQIENRLGFYAHRYRRGWEQGMWLTAGGTAIRADVLRAAQPEMRNALIFRGLDRPQLTAIFGAERVLPTDRPHVWQLRGVTRWDTGRTEATAEPVADMELDIGLIPEQLHYSGMIELFLPNRALRALAGMPAPSAEEPAVRTERWRRRMSGFLPGAIAFLAVGLANLGFEGRRARIGRLIAYAAGGYCFVVSIKVLAKLGSFDVVPPSVAVIGALALTLALATAAMWRQL